MNKIDINKDFVENSDYLKQLSLELSNKNIDDIDSNLLYEVAYADTYLGVLLSKLDPCEISDTLNDCKSVFSNVLSSVDYDRVDKCKSKIDYKNLLKCKYKNLKDASVEKSYEIKDSSNVMKEYLRFYFSSLFFIFLLFILFMFTKSFSYNFDVSGFYKFKVISSVVNYLISFIMILMICIKFICGAIDFIYISFPFFRDILKSSNFISETAKEVVKSSSTGKFVKYRVENNFKRIERNKVWLDNMISVIKDSNIDRYNDIYNSLIDVNDKINFYEKRGFKNKDYYIQLSKVEFLHDEYLSITDEINNNSDLKIICK